jgi:hypothetical protein
MIKLSCILILTFVLISCGQPEQAPDSDSIKEGNKSTTISTDTSELSRLINISVFKPVRVKFKYVLFDNSGKNERLTVPGPSDSYLEAALYFDSTTFSQLSTQYFNVDYPSPGFYRQTFDFDWLEPELRKELMQSDTSYHGHPDLFFGTGVRGKLWLLHNKLLLTKSTN